ncbi:MAG: LacI family DNA-binding transcriptional regulator [Burkholderiales bacterium]
MKGGKRLTIVDVARAAGVSVGTVSRVLNGNPKVRAVLRDKVQTAIKDLGYAPNAVAQSMRIKSTHTIGCVIREINLSALAAFVRAAHDVLDEAGFSLLLSNSEGRRERERELLARLSGRRADGIMIGPYSPVTEEFDSFLHRLNVPIVLIDRDLPSWADAVMTDHAKGVRDATEHLLDLGHRRIAIITGSPELYPARERIRGYEAAFRSRHLEPDPALIEASSFLPDKGFRYTSSVLASKRPPTAIIAGGIGMLPGVLQAIRVRGLRIPEDISVVGAGDSELSELHTPPISIQRWDQAEIGRVAASLLLDRIRGRAGAEPRQVLLPNEFVERESTGPAKHAAGRGKVAHRAAGA